MDQFGVKKPSLREIARTPDLTSPRQKKGSPPKQAAQRITKWMGATLRDLVAEEFSAYGVSKEEAGVALAEVPNGSKAARAGLQTGDVIQGVNGQAVSKLGQFAEKLKSIQSGPLELKLVRNQQVTELSLPLDKKLSQENEPSAGSKKKKG